MKLVLFFVGAFVAPTLAVYFGSVNVDGYGEVHVVGSDWSSNLVQVSNNELRLYGGEQEYGGSRVYFASKPNNDFSEDMWWRVSKFKALITVLKFLS